MPDFYEIFMLALCIWREARGESPEVRRGISHVIRNRAAAPKAPYARCATWTANILAPYQFSSFNHGDPNATKFPAGGSDQNFADCLTAAEDPGPDQTAGANYYHSIPLGSPAWPKWATEDKQTAVMGSTRFYRL